MDGLENGAGVAPRSRRIARAVSQEAHAVAPGKLL